MTNKRNLDFLIYCLHKLCINFRPHKIYNKVNSFENGNIGNNLKHEYLPSYI